MLAAGVACISMGLLHARSMHANTRRLAADVRSGAVRGVEIDPKNSTILPCDYCRSAKMRAASFKPKDYSGADPKVLWQECQHDRIGDLVHMDYIGPMPVDGIGGATGAHTFKDQATRWAWVWVSRTRTSVYDHLLTLRRELTNYWRSALRRIRTDNAPEHVSKQYLELAKEGNYLMEWSSKYTP